MQLRLPVVLLALSLLPLAGCFGAEELPAERRVSAAGGIVSQGWAYDGTGLVPAGASLEGFANNADDAGAFNVSFTLDGDAYSIAFDHFQQAEGKDFMDGGVAFELDEHGDSGVADASIPRIHATLAAWGHAKVLRNGAPVTPDAWSAHLMVSRDTVRGPDGKIAKADGASPYDPASPADARRIENDAQAILWVKDPRGETFARPQAGVYANLTCQGPQCVQSSELALEPGPETLVLNVTPVGPADQLPIGALGQGRVSVVDANGTELAGADFTLQPGGVAPTSLAVETAGAVFPLTVQVAGDGAFTIRVEGAATYVDRPFLVVTWDEVTVS